MRKPLLLLSLIVASSQVFSQSKLDKVKVFLDCSQTWICNYDYVRSEMTMVNFVRDRFDADVHILITTQNSNSGGTQAQLYFIGHRSFEGLSDTLTFFNDPTSTEDEQRKHLVQYLKLGLARYMARSKVATDIKISYTAADPAKTLAAASQKDPWNYWVFQLSTYGSLSGTESYKNRALNSSFSADRETENLKINVQFSLNKNVDIYTQDSVVTRFDRKGYNAGFDIAKSINSHWSYGLEAAYMNSLFSNIRTSYKLRPKLEYSVFPYSKFNTQRIVVQYIIGPLYYQYYDTTIYLKTREWQQQQSVNVITSFTKPWGSINIGVFYANYLKDFSRNNLNFNGAVSWKIIKGLNFALWGNYGLIHDQINLRKGSATRDELLVKNRELKSSYIYNLGIAFSYRFGSIQNNIINPRFRGLSYSINF